MLEIRCQAAPWSRAIDFLITSPLGDRIGVAQPLTLTAMESSALVASPTFSLQPEQAQSLMDQLWTCGLRPTEGSGSAGSLAATQRHLDDMRALVEKTMDVKLQGARSGARA